MSVRGTGLDPLVLPFLEGADEEHARTLLGDLLIGHASPLIRQIVGRQLLSGGGAAARVREQDAEDLHGAKSAKAAARLRWKQRQPRTEYFTRELMDAADDDARRSLLDSRVARLTIDLTRALLEEGDAAASEGCARSRARRVSAGAHRC